MYNRNKYFIIPNTFIFLPYTHTHTLTFILIFLLHIPIIGYLTYAFLYSHVQTENIITIK